MRNLLILLVAGATASCQTSKKPDRFPELGSLTGTMDVTGTTAATDTTASATGELQLDETPVTFQHLQLFAIRRTVSGDVARQANYKTLKEAIENKLIRVTESGGGNGNAVSNQRPSQNNVNIAPILATDDAVVMEEDGPRGGGGESVNALQVENTSNDTIFLMAGELVKGGKQDRVVAKDMILPPKSGKQTLPVFCVEQGRWTYHATGGSAADFNGYSNIVSNSVRDAVVNDKSQGKVWSEVDEVTTANGAATDSRTYNALANSDTYLKKTQPYLDYFKDKFKNSSDVVGVIALSGDTLIGADVFYNSFMFNKQYPNLLHSYVTDVVTTPVSLTASLQTAKKCFQKIDTEFKQAGKAADGKIAEKNRVIHYSTFSDK